MRNLSFLMIAAVMAATVAACSDETTSTATTTTTSSSAASSTSGGGGGDGTGGGGTGGGAADDPQVPPAGPAAAVQAWIDKGHYKAWKCEKAVHPNIMISPHGMQRICSNDLTSAHGAGEYPVDASGVKELYDMTGKTIVGYAVYRHVKAGTTGDTWYWYEKVPLDSPAPHDANGIVADGTGDSGPAKDICVGCHMATGIDAMHPGHDFVYTQIK